MCGVRTITVVLGTVVVLQLCVLTLGMKMGEEGVCEIPTSVQKIQFQKFSAKVKCPKKYSDCTRKESQAQKTPKGQRCCKTKVQTKEMVPSCCPGWEYNLEGKNCTATCTTGCLNGKCIAPDVCKCEEGLLLINKNQCVLPFCESPCVNGICVANDTCECSPGFNPYNATHCTTACETGYLNDPITLECVPKCDSPCVNGTCTGPNICTCIDGHTKKDDYTCTPHCTPTCVNGDCVSPDMCSCHEGYRVKSNSSSVCSPVCDVCEHGDCVAPNKCVCHEGYNTTEDGRCGPVCDKPCNNGYCSEPNTCKCHEGYEIDPLDKYSCLPKCNECTNGVCEKPNECTCNKDFTKVHGKCEPVCTKPCLNGFCSEPDRCTCNAGYIINSADKFSCVAVCEQTCINATCISPNTCSCLTGYEPTKDNNICKPKCVSCQHGECVASDVCECHEGYNMTNNQCAPVCKLGCFNGVCTAPGVCTCNDGYENMYNSSICQKPCMNGCDHGVCSINGICRCDHGYHLLNDTCTPILPVDCKECKSDCSSEACWCPDGETPCEYMAKAEMYDNTTTTTSLAGMELPWTLGGAIVLLLLTLIIVTMHRLYRKRKAVGEKTVDDAQIDRYGSVVYTVPDTLIHQHGTYDDDHDGDDADDDHNDHDGDQRHDDDVKKTELTPL